MTDPTWERLATIVPEALTLSAPERAAYLDRACTSADGTPDADLRAEAEALIAASDAADASGALVSPMAERRDVMPERIGPWRVTARLGEGGMGVVYRAERDDGLFERTVAVKVLHRGLAPGLARRLGAERRVLARLEHDGIARLYDGGVADDGTPYVVMELADGLPITEHADAAGLSVEARVRLFTQVCDAVAYAHQRLVVHRDLKPSNVFVTQGGRVKLLDFGIARVLGDDGADSLASTATRTQASMTPSYAAPEQLRLGEVTTASDVYALGVMLFELLSGARPYSLAGASPAEAERIVCETIPPPPSTVAPTDRARALRGDLDTICLKALAKEPDRRYASAEALGADLQRHLDGLPVLARPATRRYRTGRFVRRHRVGVAAAALVALAVVGGAGVALWQARAARLEAAKAVAVNDFLVGLLGAASPEADGRDVRVADLLDAAALRLDTAFAGQPDIEATAQHSLGVTYRELGLYPEAERHLGRALALAERLHGPHHADVLQGQRDLGVVLRETGDYAASDSLLSLARDAARARFGERDPRVAAVLTDLGLTRYDAGDLPGAEAAYREALTIQQAALPPDHPDRIDADAGLADVLADEGETDAAARLMERVLAARRRQRNDEATANALANLGSVRYDQHRFDEAAALQTEAVARFRRALGDDHNYVGFALNNLGSTLSTAGRYDEAERALRESVRIYGAALGPRHPDLTYPLLNLGGTLRDAGRLGESEDALAQAVSIARERLGSDHLATAGALVSLGSTLLAEDQPGRAVPVFREALAIREAALPADHTGRLVAAFKLGEALRLSGRPAEAEPLLVAAYAAAARTANAPVARDAARRLADLRQAQGRTAEARRLRAVAADTSGS